MGLPLKDYQQKALAALDAFFVAARGCTTSEQMQAAFDVARREAMGEAVPSWPYRPFSTTMPEVPVACLRIPTGGGKTLMAAHAIERAARLYVGAPLPLAIWLVPSDAIRTQTLEALKTPGHPYREALLDHYPADRLAVLDISECEQLRAQDFGGRAIVAVGTLQTLRVNRTASRDVYAYKECFESHFAGLPDADFFERISADDLAAQPYLKPSAVGKVKRSFANLLAWHRPILIVDEAHNAQSDLSAEVLQRIRPACVIEWTATPAPDQNLLYHVSAQELKAADMIKLPIVLAPHGNWEDAVRDAVMTREKLAELAKGEADYIRPIVLFQAEPANQPVTVEALRKHLVDKLRIDERRIAVATGKQRGLEGANLFDPKSPIEFVITVEALKEGWDCSFAYVFCTLQKVRSNRDMEQLLGRVLRLPYARPRKSELLNRAYAHVCAPVTAQVANQLADRLVAMGFEEIEAAQFVQPQLGGDLFDTRPRQPAETESAFEMAKEAADAIARTIPGAASVSAGEGRATVTLAGVLAAEAVERAIEAAPRKDREAVTQVLERHQAKALTAAAPSQRGERFGAIPQLAVPVQGELVLYEPEALTELTEFSLAAMPADLPGFQRGDSSHPYLIDIERGRLKIAQDDAQYGLNLDTGESVIRREDLIRALDQRLRRTAILQPDLIAWLGKALDALTQERAIELAYLARHFNDLVDACARRISELQSKAQRLAFQQTLLPGDKAARLDRAYEFEFDAARYPARWLFEGRYTFKKHFYPLPGELKPDKAEETACAIALDELEEVEWWVRNLERQPLDSFWLPTSSDRFYPDFVARLKDGRTLVVEYKGGDRYSNEDAREKRDIGKVWAAASGGKCLFVMVTDAKTGGRAVPAQIREALK
ncbi:MAG: DEAD/DEAH box helicase family protein [Woeseiaceae bacterium]